MIRTPVVGSWPPADKFADALQQYHHGDRPAQATEQFLMEVAATAIAQQCACGLDEYTGGETSADSFILHFPRVLSGIEPTENRKAWDNRNFHALLPTIQALDGIIDRVVLEFSLPEQWAERALLAEIPTSIEVAVGIIDVKSPSVESPAEIAAKIKQLLMYVPANRLLICPSCLRTQERGVGDPENRSDGRGCGTYESNRDPKVAPVYIYRQRNSLRYNPRQALLR